MPPKSYETFCFSLVLQTLNHDLTWLFSWSFISQVDYTLFDLILIIWTPLSTSLFSVCVSVCLLLLVRFLTAWVIGSGCINWRWAETADMELFQPHSQGYKWCCLAEDTALMGIMDRPVLFQKCAFQANSCVWDQGGIEDCDRGTQVIPVSGEK